MFAISLLIALVACKRGGWFELSTISLHIIGKVTDATNSSPIDHAIIELYGKSGWGGPLLLERRITNQYGQYFLYYQGEHYSVSFLLSAHGDGYSRVEVQVEEKDGETQTINFELTPNVSGVF